MGRGTSDMQIRVDITTEFLRIYKPKLIDEANNRGLNYDDVGQGTLLKRLFCDILQEGLGEIIGKGGSEEVTATCNTIEMHDVDLKYGASQ